LLLKASSSLGNSYSALIGGSVVVTLGVVLFAGIYSGLLISPLSVWPDSTESLLSEMLAITDDNTSEVIPKMKSFLFILKSSPEKPFELIDEPAPFDVGDAFPSVPLTNEDSKALAV
jgi:hypothetical protein